MTPLFYKDNVPDVDIKMTVYKGMSNVKEDFRGASIWVWILNPLRCKIPFSVTLQTDGTLVGKMPTNLPEGVYGIKILWTKDHEHDNGVCYKMHDRYMCAEVADVFAITDDEETESGEIISDDATINVKFHSATYGRDGLDAYEKAFMIGKTNLSEEAWIDKYVKEIATHAQLNKKIDDNMADTSAALTALETSLGNEIEEVDNRHNEVEAEIADSYLAITQRLTEVERNEQRDYGICNTLTAGLNSTNSNVSSLQSTTQTLSTNLSTLDDALTEHVTEFGEIIEEHDAAFAEIHNNAKTKRLQVNDSTGAEAGHIDVTETGTLEFKSEANKKVHIEGGSLDIDTTGDSHYMASGTIVIDSGNGVDVAATSNVNVFAGNKFRVHSSKTDSDDNVILSSSTAGVYVDNVPFVVRNINGQALVVGGSEIKARCSDTLSIAIQEGSNNRVNIVAPEIRWVEKKTVEGGSVVDVEHKFTKFIKNAERAGSVRYRNRGYEDYPTINVAEELEVFYDYGRQCELGLTGTETKSPYRKYVHFNTNDYTSEELEDIFRAIPNGAPFIGISMVQPNKDYLLTILCGIYKLEVVDTF